MSNAAFKADTQDRGTRSFLMRLQLVHSDFVTPKNDSALKSMDDGWKKVLPNIGSIANELGEKN